MGVACLGQPRSKAQLMKLEKDPNSRYSSVGEKVQKGAESGVVAGDAQGNKMKIKLNLITCSVCMQNYNITTRQPQIICANNHTYCKECTAQFNRTNRRCPQCRQQMRNPVIRNRDVYQLVEDNQQIIEQNKLEAIVDEPSLAEDVRITVDSKNNCIQSFWVQGERVMKIENDRIWEGFISNEILPIDRQSSYSVKVLCSKFNNIELGIVGKGYKLQSNVTCRESVVYHLSDGRILQGSKGQASEWKGQGAKYQKSSGNSSIITVKVNPKEWKVSWWQGDKLLGVGRFSEFLKKREFVAYVMMCHKQDIVELNP